MTADKPWIENVFGVLADAPEPREMVKPLVCDCPNIDGRHSGACSTRVILDDDMAGFEGVIRIVGGVPTYTPIKGPPDPRDARIAALEAALGWIPLSIREAIRTGNVEAAKEWATRSEVRNAEQAARIAELEERLAASRDHFVREEFQHGETANRLDEWRGRVVAAETQRDTYAAALRDALDALSLMTGFVEAQHYVEKYGVNETLARLRALLPPETAVSP